MRDASSSNEIYTLLIYTLYTLCKDNKDTDLVVHTFELKLLFMMFSFWNRHSHPASFSFRMVVRLSTVFRANRLTDFVTIRSILPSSAS